MITGFVVFLLLAVLSPKPSGAGARNEKDHRPTTFASKEMAYSIYDMVVLLLSGCVRSVPSLPEHKEANTKQLGILGLRSVDAPPAVLYQRPPKGVVDGLLRGTRRGAVVGAHVGWDLAKWFTLAGPKTSEECVRTTNEGAKCYYFALITPIIGLLALIAIPPAITTAAGIQAGFTAYSSAEVEKWEKALADAQEALQIQATMRESVRHSLSSCCHMYLPPAQGEMSASPHSSNVIDFRAIDIVLETEVLELGLAEATSEELAAPDENMHALKPDLA